MAMQPLYYRKRRVPLLFMAPRERKHVMHLLNQGANPLVLRKGIPLFWYAAFEEGGAWIAHSNLSAEELEKPGLFARGAQRSLWDQLLLPSSIPFKQALGWKNPSQAGSAVLANTNPHIQLKIRFPASLKHYDSIVAALLAKRGSPPTVEECEVIQERPWPQAQAALSARNLTEATPGILTQETQKLRL